MIGDLLLPLSVDELEEGRPAAQPTVWAPPSLLEERAQAIDRTSQRLARLIEELRELEPELDALDQRSRLPELSEEARLGLTAELELAVNAYNHLREAADCAYRQLILERESCGFRGHAVLERCYPIPDLLLTADVVVAFDQR